MALKPPARTLVVQNGAVAPPGLQKIVCQEVNFTLAAGKALGVIGPTASGKSSLARMLVGVWRPLRGTVRLDGATLDQWSSETLGRHVGYVPQDVELFNGTVAQNICRFEDPPDPDALLSYAQIKANFGEFAYSDTAQEPGWVAANLNGFIPACARPAVSQVVPRSVVR